MRDPWDAKLCAELKKKGSGIVTDPRFRIESVTCFGIIPGPKKPKTCTASCVPSLMSSSCSPHNNTPTTVNLRPWKCPAISDYAIEQQVLKAYLGHQLFEKLSAQGGTNIRIQYEHGENMRARCGAGKIPYRSSDTSSPKCSTLPDATSGGGGGGERR